MHHCLTLFIIFGQRPGTNCLYITSSKAGSAVGIEDVATSRLIEHRPDFESFAQLPATAVEHGAPTIELRGFALVARTFGKIIKGLLAWYFQADGFKSCVHEVIKRKKCDLGANLVSYYLDRPARFFGL